MATPGMGAPGMGTPSSAQRLPPEVNRILYIRNLPFNISAEEMYKIFGDYGPIRQIRQCAAGWLACDQPFESAHLQRFTSCADTRRDFAVDDSQLSSVFYTSLGKVGRACKIGCVLRLTPVAQ